MSTTIRPGSVAEAFVAVARQARAQIPNLSERERQALKDIERLRNGFTAVERLVAICARANDVALVVAPSEALRQLALRTHPTPSLDACDDRETDAQCEADKAVAAVRRDPRSLSARRRARTAALRESVCARQLADALAT